MTRVQKGRRRRAVAHLFRLAASVSWPLPAALRSPISITISHAARCQPELRRCSKCNRTSAHVDTDRLCVGSVPVRAAWRRRRSPPTGLGSAIGIIVSLLALALAPSLVWLDIASLTLGMMSAVAQVLVALAAQLC